jgi:hypothetical protein
MSPAVARGEAEDTRCDIYAFGALLYELLTGQPPYTGRTPQIILDQVLKGPPCPLLSRNPKASPALVKIAEGSMARELRDRYASMADVVTDLEHVAQGTAPLGTHQRQRRSPLRLAAAILATLAVAVLAGVALRHFSSTARTPVPGASSPTSDVPGRTAVEPKSQTVSTPVLAGTGEGDPTQVENNTPPVGSAELPPTGAQYGPFTYTTLDRTITITKYTGRDDADVAIPSNIAGYPVTGIGSSAFAGCQRLTTVTIPPHVTRIGKDAFSGCKNLADVTILGDVAVIENSMFKRCVSLTNVVIAGKTERIEGEAFSGCHGLANLSLPESLTYIGLATFSSCCKLTSLTIPNAVKQIDNGAFMNCTALATVFLPEKLEILGGSAFEGCSQLASVAVPNGVKTLDRRVFAECASLKEVTLPNGLFEIGAQVFMNCAALSQITIPDKVKGIGGAAFMGCANLSLVTLPTQLVMLTTRTFSGCIKLRELIIPSNVYKIVEYAFEGCRNLEGLYFMGTAPALGLGVIEGAENATIYYRPGTKGWGPTFGGRPTAVWEEDE